MIYAIAALSLFFIVARFRFGSEVNYDVRGLGLSWFGSYKVFAHLFCGYLIAFGIYGDDAPAQWTAWVCLAWATAVEAFAFFFFAPTERR